MSVIMWRGEILTLAKWKQELKCNIVFFSTFKKFHIAIWFWMLLEDVMEIRPILMPQVFIDQFFFIWGQQQCSMTSNQLKVGTYYYLKDLRHVYFTCWGLPYGKENHTLFVEDELNKALWNFHCSGLFIKSFRGQKLSRRKVQWLDLASRSWPTLIGLPLASAINIHYEILVKYLKLHLNSSSPNYSWFMQYMENYNGDGRFTPLPLGMHFELQHLENN